jgi:DNA invertase Pin-like site-specific DNA recombinase
MNSQSKSVARCAIYTRKSSEEGLEMSFNSLDAQREACQAFIASQRQEGWRYSQLVTTTVAIQAATWIDRHFNSC